MRLQPGGAAPGERRHELGWESCAEDLAARPDHGARVERGLDRAPDVIARHEAHEHRTRFDHAAALPHPHARVIVLEIAVVGVGAQVHPFTQVSVTEETLVLLVAPTLHDALFDLAPDLADGPERCPGM